MCLRAALREGPGELAVRDGDVLHARLSGPLPINTDVENALLYNVGGFARTLMRNGVRFDLGDEPTEGALDAGRRRTGGRAGGGAPRVAADLGEREADVASALLDRSRAVLGLVKGLRRPSGWSPSDNRCVAADIRLRPGDAWTVQGDVVTVVPLSSVRFASGPRRRRAT